jgi:Leucine-rich repeat (LRR) protein
MKANIFFKLARVLLMIAIFGSVFALPNQSTSAQPLNETLDCGSTEIPTLECMAFLAFYNTTNGATWTNHTGWLETNTPCSWYGVSCTAGHVSSLNLSSNQLSGTIPMQLSYLTELQTLNLSSNQISGTIPKELGTLTKLTEFDLGANQLSGSIPADLGGLTNLTELDLSSNLLTGPIPTVLGDLTNLTRLDLGNNLLTDPIPQKLGSLTNLTELDL